MNKDISLIYLCVDASAYEDLNEIQLLLKDHGFYRDKSYIEKHIKDRLEENLLNSKVNMLYYGAKNRAEKKDIDFNLTKDWIIENLKPGVCQITGIPFKFKYEGSNPYAPSIDRRDNFKGYTKDNCDIVLISYNKFKSDYRIEDINHIIERMVSVVN